MKAAGKRAAHKEQELINRRVPALPMGEASQHRTIINSTPELHKPRSVRQRATTTSNHSRETMKDARITHNRNREGRCSRWTRAYAFTFTSVRTVIPTWNTAL